MKESELVRGTSDSAVERRRMGSRLPALAYAE